MLFDIFLYLCLIKHTSEMKQLLFVLILITTAFLHHVKKNRLLIQQKLLIQYRR